MNNDRNDDSKTVVLDAQSNHAMPEHATLQIWMSALLDGELGEAETEALYAAFEKDEMLLYEFEAFSASVSSQEALLSNAEQNALTDAILAATSPTALNNSADAQCRAASALIDNEADAAQFSLLSQPKEADAKKTNAFVSAASQVLAFVEAQETVSLALNELSTAPALQAFFAAHATEIMHQVQKEEDLAILLQGAFDNQLNDTEQNELNALVKAFRGDFSHLILEPLLVETIEITLSALTQHPAAALAGQRALDKVELDAKMQNLAQLFIDNAASESECDLFQEWMFGLNEFQIEDHLQAGILLNTSLDEVMHASFAAFAEYPEAQRAGDAALAAISASQAIATDALHEKTHAKVKVNSIVAAPAEIYSRILSFFQPFFSHAATPALFAACAALVFFVNQGSDLAPDPLRNNAHVATGQPLGTPVAEILKKDVSRIKSAKKLHNNEALLTDELAYLQIGELQLLDDNSKVEVQALEAGSPTAMVFSTEASNITVIWVGELEDSATEVTE